MSIEIERKFKVNSCSEYASLATEVFEMRQGYISDSAKGVVRVRTKGKRGYLTVKSANQGCKRYEWEYEIPYDDAVEMINSLCSRIIEKVRYIIPYSGKIWEVDVFGGRLEGLVLAEVEIQNPDEKVEIPLFVGAEVTNDARYYNSNLCRLESLTALK